MIKYEICKYIDEIRGSFDKTLTEQDIAEMIRYSDCVNFEWLESFNDEQEARDYFEKKYRKLASTTVRQCWYTAYLYVEYYHLLKMEYDEENELSQGDIIAEIYEPFIVD